MGLFNFLFRKKPKISIQHPYFGEMTYHSDRWSFIKNHLTCEPYFKPVSAKIPLHIVAEEEGPTPAQTDYFQLLELHYTSLFPVIASRIKEATYNSEEEFIFDDFSKDFRLINMQMYSDKSGALQSELTFLTDLAPEYSFSVVLQGLEFKEVMICE